MSPHLLFLKYSLAVSSLAPIMHVCATNYYQVGMHRFAIRELGVDDAMWPVQKYIPVPETVGEPVFNRHHLVRMIRPGAFFFLTLCPVLGFFSFFETFPDCMILTASFLGVLGKKLSFVY